MNSRLDWLVLSDYYSIYVTMKNGYAFSKTKEKMIWITSIKIFQMCLMELKKR